MKSERKIIGFIDILGFTGLINEYENGDKTILNDVVEAMNLATNFLDAVPDYSEKLKDWRGCLEIKLFSDCMCISVPLEHDIYEKEGQFKMFYKYLMGYQLILMENGLVTRGGVTIGNYYSDNNIIFSKGLVDAYELEGNDDKMPRVLLSPEILSYVKDFDSTLLSKMICIENDISFLNPFNNALVDSEIADSLMKTLPLTGTFDYSFSEQDIKNKIEVIKEVIDMAIKNIDKFVDKKGVRKKYEWLLEFCTAQLKGLE